MITTRWAPHHQLLPLALRLLLPKAAPFDGCRSKPLALYGFTNSESVKEHLLAQTTSGGVLFNDCLLHDINHNLPWGGVGTSGRLHGIHGFKELYVVRTNMLPHHIHIALQRPLRDGPQASSKSSPPISTLSLAHHFSDVFTPLHIFDHTSCP